MWFCIKFFLDRPSIYAVIACDMRVYFRAMDVANFLGYTNTFGFASRHAKRDLSEVIPRAFLKIRQKRILVYTFEEMLAIIEKTQRNHQLLCCTTRVKEMIHLWESGLVQLKSPNIPALHLQFAPHLYLHKLIGESSVGDWIRAYSLVTADLYSRAFQPHFSNTLNDQSTSANTESQQIIINENDGIDVEREREDLQTETLHSIPDPSTPVCTIDSMEVANYEEVDSMKSPPPSVAALNYFLTPPPSVSTTFQNFDFEMCCDGLIKPPEKINLRVRGVKYEYSFST